MPSAGIYFGPVLSGLLNRGGATVRAVQSDVHLIATGDKNDPPSHHTTTRRWNRGTPRSFHLCSEPTGLAETDLANRGAVAHVPTNRGHGTGTWGERSDQRRRREIRRSSAKEECGSREGSKGRTDTKI